MDFERLRAECAPEWSKILQHPVVRAIGRGILPDDKMRYFVSQDYRYLKDFSLTLTLASGRAPTLDIRRMLLQHAQNVFLVEHGLHERVAPQLGLPADGLTNVPIGPATLAYTNHLVRTAYTGSFADITAALLPCYVTYRKIGLELYREGLPDHPVQREWILTYQGEAYGEAVREIEDMARTLVVTSADQPGVDLAYHHSMVYERLFWEQADRMGTW